MTPYLRQAVIYPFLADQRDTPLWVEMRRCHKGAAWSPGYIDDRRLIGYLEQMRPAASEAGRKAAHELLEQWKVMG